MQHTKAAQHTPGLCQKCKWEHTADSVKGTSFRGVKLCPLHAAAPDLLAALQSIADGAVMAGAFTHAETVHKYQQISRAAITQATGGA